MKTILDRVLESPLVGEVIAVDDASTDATLDILRGYDDDRLRVLAQPVNRAKAPRCGAASPRRRCLCHRPGRRPRVRPARVPAHARSPARRRGRRRLRLALPRRRRPPHPVLLAHPRQPGADAGSNMATNLNLTDMETCYKVFRREVLQQITSRRTASVSSRRSPPRSPPGCRVYEVGISYYGRTYDDGKKIGWRDGVRAIFCIVAYSPPGSGSGCDGPARSSPGSPAPDARPWTGAWVLGPSSEFHARRAGATMEARAVNRENDSHRSDEDNMQPQHLRGPRRAEDPKPRSRRWSAVGVMAGARWPPVSPRRQRAPQAIGQWRKRRRWRRGRHLRQRQRRVCRAGTSRCLPRPHGHRPRE